MFTGMMPPQAAPPQSQSVEFRTVPGQRAQFKSFMQGMRAKPAMNPPISPPQIPVNISPMDMIDIFDQPVQMMQRGGITNRPMDDDNQSRSFPKIEKTPQVKEIIKQESLRRRQEKKRRDDERREAKKERQAVANRNIQQNLAIATGKLDPEDAILDNMDLRSKNFRSSLNQSERDELDQIRQRNFASLLVDPRNQSGLGNTLSQQIAALRGPEDFGGEFGTDDLLNQRNVVGNFGLEFGNQEQQDQMQGIGNLISRSIPPTGLNAFNPFAQLGTRMAGNILSKINEGGEAVRDDSGMIVGVIHDGLLGGKVYTGRPGFNPFAPPERPERDVFQAPKAVTDPCPDGFQLVNGVCQPIASDTATQTPMITAAPTATTPTTQVIVPSTRQSAPIEQVAPVAFPVDMISNLTKPFGMQEGGAVSDTLTAATDRFLESMRAAS
jgi:hypothetical protein